MAWSAQPTGFERRTTPALKNGSGKDAVFIYFIKKTHGRIAAQSLVLSSFAAT
jgi:hypothetical protein